MSSTVLYMSMSLDGFIAGPGESPDNALGDGGERLHEWVFDGSGDHPRDAVGGPGSLNSQVVDEFMSTGAVIAGRGTFEPAGGWSGDHHDGVPPILMGDGRRLFEHLGIEQRQLERVRVLEGEGGVTHLRYRVLR